MQRLEQAIWDHIWKYSEEMSNKCKKCRFASANAGDLRTHLKTHSAEKTNKKNNVIMHLPVEAILGDIWKHTVEKSPTNATNVTLHLLRQGIWEHIWKYTVEKNQINAISVSMHPLGQAV